MLELSFGTDPEREHALHGIRTIHTRVHGHLPETVGVFPAGSLYSAEDPALVLWVHLTLLESIPLTYELFVGPISGADRDSYCSESAWVATALGARPGDVPVTWAHASELLARTYSSGVLCVGRQAQELALAVLSPRLTRMVPPLASWNRRIAVGLLPSEMRRQYGLTWSHADQRHFDRSVVRLRRLRRLLPDVVALWPQARA